MQFRKKKTYEDVYKWRRHDNGSCFYCYEDKPVAYAFVGEKGICQECLDQFKIGHAGTDRHVIAYLTKSLKTHEETVEWLKKNGLKLMPNGRKNDVHHYIGVNNLGIFNSYCSIIYDQVDISTIGPNTTKKILDSYNDIEIFNDGSIRILY